MPITSKPWRPVGYCNPFEGKEAAIYEVATDNTIRALRNEMIKCDIQMLVDSGNILFHSPTVRGRFIFIPDDKIEEG